MIVLPPGDPVTSRVCPSAVDDDRRRHRREHALAGFDRIGHAPDQPIRVRRVRARRKVVHLVVQQKSCAFDDDLRTERQIQRGRARDGVARRVHHREMRRLRTFVREPGADAGRRRRACRVEVGETLNRIGFVDQLRDRHRIEVGIAEILGPVGVGAPLGFDHEMDRRRRPIAGRFDVERLQHVQHLHEQHATRRRRRHRIDLVTTVGTFDRFAPHRTVVGEILGGDQSAAALHLGNDQLRRLAGVETILALRSDQLERLAEFRLLESIALSIRAAVLLQEHARAAGMFCEFSRGLAELLREIVVQHETVVRQANCRRHDRLARQRAVFLEHVEHAGDAARHAGGEMRLCRKTRYDVAGCIEIHVALRSARRTLAMVVRDDAAVGETDHHESAATEIAGVRIRHRQRESGCNRGIDRIAAVTHDVGADLRRECGARRNHAVLAAHRFGTRRPRDAVQRDDYDEPDQQTGCAIHANPRSLERQRF